jgi:signal transduction histidine kinase
MKTRFIAMTSHEFRTPLASIRGSVELLMHYENRMPATRKKQVLQNINDAVERMTHMLGNVMQIGRADAGQLQFRPKPMALTPFCLALIDELQGSMPRQFAQVKLALDLPPEGQSLVLDEALIRNIVGNLLSNAVKYSPQGGTVRLSACAAHDHWHSPSRSSTTVSDLSPCSQCGEHCRHRFGALDREAGRRLPPGAY